MAKATRRGGRREWYWREVIERQPESGLSIRAFCRRSGIREWTFYSWRRKLRDREGAGEAEVTFLPVRVTEPARPGGASIEIVLPGDRRVRVSAPVDREALREVLAALEARPPVPEASAC